VSVTEAFGDPWFWVFMGSAFAAFAIVILMGGDS